MSNGIPAGVAVVPASSTVGDTASLSGGSLVGSVFNPVDPGQGLTFDWGNGTLSHQYVDSNGVTQTGTGALPSKIVTVETEAKELELTSLGRYNASAASHDLIKYGSGDSAKMYDYRLNPKGDGLEAVEVKPNEDGFMVATDGTKRQLLVLGEDNKVRMATGQEIGTYTKVGEATDDPVQAFGRQKNFQALYEGNTGQRVDSKDVDRFIKQSNAYTDTLYKKEYINQMRANQTDQQWNRGFGLIDKTCQAVLTYVQARVQLSQAAAQMEMVGIQRLNILQQGAAVMADITAKKELNATLAANAGEANRLQAKVEITKARLNARNQAEKIHADGVVQLFAVRNTHNMGNPWYGYGYG